MADQSRSFYLNCIDIGDVILTWVREPTENSQVTTGLIEPKMVQYRSTNVIVVPKKEHWY